MDIKKVFKRFLDELDKLGEKLFSEIKDNLKKIPRKDLFPSFPSNETEKQNKVCIVDGNTYQVGEKWTDAKTGQSNMCVLTYVPKDIQKRIKGQDTSFTEIPTAEPRKSRKSIKKYNVNQEIDNGNRTGKPDDVKLTKEKNNIVETTPPTNKAYVPREKAYKIIGGKTEKNTGKYTIHAAVDSVFRLNVFATLNHPRVCRECGANWQDNDFKTSVRIEAAPTVDRILQDNISVH